MVTNPTRRFLTPAETAEHLGITPADLTRLRASDHGPDWVLINRTIRYSLADLTWWQTQHRQSRQ